MPFSRFELDGLGRVGVVGAEARDKGELRASFSALSATSQSMPNLLEVLPRSRFEARRRARWMRSGRLVREPRASASRTASRFRRAGRRAPTRSLRVDVRWTVVWFAKRKEEAELVPDSAVPGLKREGSGGARSCLVGFNLGNSRCDPAVMLSPGSDWGVGDRGQVAVSMMDGVWSGTATIGEWAGRCASAEEFLSDCSRERRPLISVKTGLCVRPMLASLTRPPWLSPSLNGFSASTSGGKRWEVLIMARFGVEGTRVGAATLLVCSSRIDGIMEPFEYPAEDAARRC